MNFNRVLITGVTGLLGSWLAKDFLNKNIEVIGIALDTEKNFLIDSMNISNDIDIDYFDIADNNKFIDFYKTKDFDVAIHLAAQTQVKEALNDPVQTFESNIKGTWNILENSRIFNKPLVVASSDKAYGISTKLPYEENFELKGEYPYEFSKTATDMLCTTYRKTYNLQVSVLRCGNIYGGGDLNWDRLIPGVTKWLLNKEQPVLRTKGQFKRDWVYVEDVANAYISVTNALLDVNKEVSGAYNFSSNDYLSVMDIYEKVCNTLEKKYVEPLIQEDSEFEIEDQYLSSNKIRDELDVVAKIGIDEGLKRTVNWYKSNLNIIEKI